MTVTIDLGPELGEALRKKAAANGSPVNAYVRNLIEQHIDLGPTYEEVMAPVWKKFGDSGMTDEELNELIDRERQEIWNEKHSTRG